MIPRGATIQNALRFALGIFSGRMILIFRVCRTLRSAPNAIFTEEDVTGSGICSSLGNFPAMPRALPLGELSPQVTERARTVKFAAATFLPVKMG